MYTIAICVFFKLLHNYFMSNNNNSNNFKIIMDIIFATTVV